MNFQKKVSLKRSSLFMQTLIINIAVCCSVILISLGVILFYSLSQIRSDIRSNIKNLAYSMAKNYMIYDSLISKRASSNLTDYLDSILDNADEINVISVIDNKRVCIYHQNREINGLEIPIVPDNTNSVQFAKISFGTDAKNHEQWYICAFAPVLNARDLPIGYVIVGVSQNSIFKQELSYLIKFSSVAVVSLFAMIAASLLITVRIKKTLMGNEPEQISHRLLRQAEVLDTLEEGILAVDKDGTIILSNTTAAELLQLNVQGTKYGKALIDLYPDSHIMEILSGAPPIRNQQKTVKQKHLLLDCIPIKEDGHIIGAVEIIRDQTAMTAMAKELTGYTFILDSLRSNIHNFKNELHIILGMLELGEVKAAIQYISCFNSGQDTMNNVLNLLQNKTIAALVLGKIHEAKEHGIEFLLDSSSFLPAHNAYLSINQLTILLGNLLENAIEATKPASDFESLQPQIRLLVQCDEEELQITVDDSGRGIPFELQKKIFEHGYSTKKNSNHQHGIGLALVQQIVDSTDGILTLDSAPGEGTSISIYIKKHRY